MLCRSICQLSKFSDPLVHHFSPAVSSSDHQAMKAAVQVVFVLEVEEEDGMEASAGKNKSRLAASWRLLIISKIKFPLLFNLEAST